MENTFALRSLDTIFPYTRNAKDHPPEQIERIKKSIFEFGFNQPLVVDKNGVLIVGHGRFQAAKELGLKEVPCLVKDLTEQQAKSYRLADNKIAESNWKMELVIEELKDLNIEMAELTGFSLENLESLQIVTDPQAEWAGMPGYISEDKTAFKQILVSFKDEAGVQEFAEKVGQRISMQTRSIWYPEVSPDIVKDLRY